MFQPPFIFGTSRLLDSFFVLFDSPEASNFFATFTQIFTSKEILENEVEVSQQSTKII